MVNSSEYRHSGRRRMDAGDLAPLVAQFTHQLSEAGYTDFTVGGFDDAARHLAHWLAQVKATVAGIDEAVIGRFARHRCQCPGSRRENHVSVKYMGRVRQFVEFLRERAIVQHETPRGLLAPNRRVVEFQSWLRQHRGLSEMTVDQHGRMLLQLLPALGPRPRSWDAHGIRDVMIAETTRASRGHVKKMASALRGYVRFLSAHGLCRAGLEHAVPIIPQWRLSTLPRYIDAAQVEQLIATCDTATPTGLRDRAILLLLARLGLRAGDIVSLRLDALDWPQATVSVRGKGIPCTRSASW